MTQVVTTFLSWVVIANFAVAAEADPKSAAFFTTQVQPILQQNCFKCHSHTAEKIKGGLVMDSLDGLLNGGENGPALVPGYPDKSLFITAIRYTNDDLQMPPKGKKLSAPQIATLEQWVRDGAIWPGQTGQAKKVRGKITDEDRAWWSFQPLAKPPIPGVKNAAWAKNEIDRFLLQKLEASGLQPSKEASRVALARRVYFDLTGLPPAPKEMDAFLSDSSPDAYEKLVDQLLASPRYGERWARHWLDLVRYADSDGYRIDDLRPTAWRYRDYVIQSFNDDKPYNRFVHEQLAGDEITPRDPEALIATGYLRHWIYEYNNRDVVGQWTTILNDLTDTTSDVFLGMGVQCARCHDHKFDPILQKDYYRLQAFFAPLLPREDLDVGTETERVQYKNRFAQWEEMTKDLREQIAGLEAPHRVKAGGLILPKFPEETLVLIEKPVAERTPWEHQIAELAYRQVSYEYGRMKVTGPDKEKLLALQKKLAKFDEFKPAPLPHALIATDVGATAPPVFIPKKAPTPVEPGFLSVLQEAPAIIKPPTLPPNTTGRRTELARWITDPENPLATRVIVNRVWQYHFGRGFVSSASDFGRLGEKPSHPELLDWLARRFVQDGWSFKKLHRLILTSAAYRQASDGTAQEAAKLDPENRLLWHGPIHRLDAEQIRDTILSVTGELQIDTGGPAVDAFKPRRSIYTKVLRNNRDPLLDAFDAPQHFSSTSQRNTTTTPVQSLLLINSQFMLQRAAALAGRLQKSGAKNDAEMITAAYLLAFNRPPTKMERAAAMKFLREQPARVDPTRSASAAAAFIADKIPYRDGKAAVMSPQSTQDRLVVTANQAMPEDSFTIEAFIVLRSVYEDASVRTIASHWGANKTDPGWALGVTSLKSMRRPQTLVLQLTGRDASGAASYEPIFSDLNINLSKPYFVAATVSLGDTNEGGVTFYVKDLSNDDEPMQVAKVAHRVVKEVESKAAFVIGGRAVAKEHLFDGLIDDVRLSRGALKQEQLLLTAEGVTAATCGYWQFEQKPDVFRDSSPNKNDIKPQIKARATPADRKTAALIDFCHILLNANEFLYVE